MALRRFFYALALTGSLIFYAAYSQWFSYLLLLTVIGTPWLSLALSLPAMFSFRLEPKAPARLRPGTPVEATLLGCCRLPHPPLRGSLRVTHSLTEERCLLRPGEPLPTEHCGCLMLEPAKARVYDYLGLFCLRVRKLDSSATLILPEPVKMEVPPDLSRFLARAWRPKFGGGFAENHELRLYRPGDNLNQVHWKLSAKTGKLILREPMEPERGRMLLTMDICGSADELDEKFGRFVWLGRYLLERGVHFEARVLTGAGMESCTVENEAELNRCVESLLRASPAESGSVRDRIFAASWQYYIGGQSDET